MIVRLTINPWRSRVHSEHSKIKVMVFLTRRVSYGVNTEIRIWVLTLFYLVSIVIQGKNKTVLCCFSIV